MRFSALSHPLFVGEWACPSRCTNPLHPHSHFKRTSTASPHTNTLASLVKGRWIDGTTQTFVLLLPACVMPTFFILQTFLPSRRRDCSPFAPSMRFSALSLSPHHPCHITALPFPLTLIKTHPHSPFSP